MKTVNDFKGGVFLTWEEIRALGINELTVYCGIKDGCSWNESKNGDKGFSLSYSKIQEVFGIATDKTVNRVISKLKDKGLIYSVTKNLMSKYFVNTAIQSDSSSAIQSDSSSAIQKDSDIPIDIYTNKNTNNNNNTIEPSTKEPCKGVGVVFNFEGDNEVEVSSIFKSSRSALKEMADRASSFSIKHRFEKIPSVEDITGDLSWMSNRKAKEDRMHDAQIIRTRLMKKVV